MKNSIKIIVFISILSVFTSCQEKQNTTTEKKTDNNHTEQLAINLKKVALDIEGMTCEIGCARTIQSKLSKADGIKSAKVNFETKSGIVAFDANVISEKQIVSLVEQIAGGDLYKIIEVTAEE